jgi:hypothetical protein
VAEAEEGLLPVTTDDQRRRAPYSSMKLLLRWRARIGRNGGTSMTFQILRHAFFWQSDNPLLCVQYLHEALS